MAKVNIDLNSLQPNSHKYKEEQKKSLEKGGEAPKPETEVIPKKTGIVSTKKSLGEKFKEAFISTDSQDVKTYILKDWLVPMLQNGILDTIEMIFFGGGSSRLRRGGYGDRDRTPYSSYYASEYNGRRNSRRGGSDRDRGDRRYEFSNEKVDYRNIVLRDRRDAEDVVNYLKGRIQKYGHASIADFIDWLGDTFEDFKATSNYVDNNWGWVDERDIGIRRVSQGYLIDVEEVVYLE